jgi:hypothetical protein
VILPFVGNYPVTRGYIKSDPNMPVSLWDPLYGPTHRGIDYALPPGTRLVAALSGKVTAAGFSPDGAGNIVVIRSGDLLVKYFHMSTIAVTVGQNVQEGQTLGTSGASGNTKGPHLHFQVEEGLGNAVDPAKYLSVGNPVTEEPMLNEGDIINIYRATDNRNPVPDEIKAYLGKPFKSILYDQVVPKLSQISKNLKTTTEIANMRANWINQIAQKVGVDAPTDGAKLEKLFSSVSPPTDAARKLEQVKEIVKE